MRPEGVRQTITFVAKSTPQRPMQTTEQPGGSDNGPILPIEVLAQVAEVLSALPSTVPPEEYFKQISPQMIQLLTDKDPDARRAAAYTISHGILNKRRFGQVGAIGWQYFAEPLISVINNSTPDTEPAGSLLHQMQALKALSTLIFAFPNPALSKRLLKPINLPLWAICCLPGGNSVGKDLAMRLLEHYIDSVAGSKGLLTIVDGLMYQGDPGWILQPNLDMDSGETYLDIKPSISKESENLSKIYHIKPRIDRFMRLVDACHDDTEIGLFLANILQRTMRPDSSSLNSESEDILQPVIDANIAKELISTRSSRLKGNIVNIVSVIEEVLANQLSAIQMIQASQDSAVSRSMLATIITHSQHTECSLPVQDLENTLGICLPWLILVAESNAESIHQEIRDDSRSLQSLLSTILSISKLSRASKDAIRLVLSLHTRQESDSNSPAAAYIDQHTKDLELHTIAMNNLMATEPPIRVQGLSQLEALVVCDSPLTSTSAATLTVMSLLSDEDSFVYLSAIKTLTVLVRKDPSPAVKTLQEAYHDVIEQSTIDVRLRMGEVLQTVFEEIGPHLPSTPLKNLVEMLLFLSSRRVYRDKTHTAQSRASALSRAVEADEADSDDESGDAGRKSERDLQSILDSWQGKSGSEDLRIRTSALTLLGTAFEHADFAILSLFIHPSLEVITQIIRLELGQENAIIRRAAVLVVLSIIRGQQNSGRYTSTLMNAEPSGREESIDSITALLGAVAVEDDDPIVRGHAENVIQALREWRENILEALVRGDDIRTGLENQAGDFRLRGLHINPSLHSETGKGKGHKIEEVE